MNRYRHSIKGRLFVWIFSFTSLFLIALGLVIYHEVREIVFGVADLTLHAKAQMISGLVHQEENEIELELEEGISGEYSIPRSGHYYKILMDGDLFTASTSLVDKNFDFAAGAVEIHDAGRREKRITSTGPDGEPIRVLQYELKAFGKTFTILVAENLTDSLDMIQEFKQFLFTAIPVGILVVSFIAIWIAKYSLKPIEVFSGRIRAITHNTLGDRIDTRAETSELEGLAGSFNDMLDRLQKVFESEKQLIADASHELKTPLSVIMLQCDVTLQRERRPEEYIDALNSIRSVTEGINAIVKNLLLLARLDSGLLSSKGPDIVSLNDCIGKAAAMVQPFAEKRSIRVVKTLGVDIAIAGNTDNLAEAFLNILENGVKYNNDNGAVEISSTWNGVEAVVSIRDTGVGIRKADQERIFDRFYRADTTRNTDGTGLGLSIAKAIIEAYGGKIALESEPKEGSTFTITLPGLCSDATG